MAKPKAPRRTHSADGEQKLTILPSDPEWEHISTLIFDFAQLGLRRKVNRSNLARFALAELQANPESTRRFAAFLHRQFPADERPDA